LRKSTPLKAEEIQKKSRRNPLKAEEIQKKFRRNPLHYNRRNPKENHYTQGRRNPKEIRKKSTPL